MTEARETEQHGGHGNRQERRARRARVARFARDRKVITTALLEISEIGCHPRADLLRRAAAFWKASASPNCFLCNVATSYPSALLFAWSGKAPKTAAVVGLCHACWQTSDDATLDAAATRCAEGGLPTDLAGSERASPGADDISQQLSRWISQVAIPPLILLTDLRGDCQPLVARIGCFVFLRGRFEAFTVAKLFRPMLFSQHFGINPAMLNKAGLLDPFLNADTKLFIDPLLLRHSSNPLVSGKGLATFRKRMKEILDLLMATETNSGPAWTAALRLLNLQERRETCLGYGGEGTSGSSRPTSLQTRILSTAREIANLGMKNPEIIGLMGILEEKVGPDTISDLTTNSIMPILEEITNGFCKPQGIPTKKFIIDRVAYELPENPLDRGHAFALVPKDILRELPVAADWSDIDRVVSHNAMLRDAVNKMLGNIAKATVTDKKRALKKAALTSAKGFKRFFDDMLGEHFKSYDFSKDKRAIEALRQAIIETSTKFPLKIDAPTARNAAELKRVVDLIVAQFKQLVEHNDLSRLLWDGSKPRSEKSSQLVFFGVADSYCRANNIDISPEVNAGGGPVDFKFSSGYKGRLLVEIKLSTGTVEHGYRTQLGVYQTAAKSEEGLFIVINVGKLGRKGAKILAAQKAQRKVGHRAPDIVIVDATKKPSASKR